MAALTASCIDLNIQGNGAYSVLKQLATIALQNGFITDSHQFLQTLLLREKMHSTGFGSGVAVPHGKSACVKQPFVLFARKAQAIQPGSLTPTWWRKPWNRKPVLSVIP